MPRSEGGNDLGRWAFSAEALQPQGDRGRKDSVTDLLLDPPLSSTHWVDRIWRESQVLRNCILSCCLFPFRLSLPAGNDSQASDPQSPGPRASLSQLRFPEATATDHLPTYELELRVNHDRDSALCMASDASHLSWSHPTGFCEAV